MNAHESLPNDVLSLYLADIRDHPLLTREEEARLARRIRRGDPAALQELVGANLRFVVTVARKYQNMGMSLPDLIAEGNVGLVRAAQKFDEKRGVKFISYAVWWIRQAILKGLAENARTFRLPVHQATTVNRLARVEAELGQRLGRDATPEEVAEAMDMDPADVWRTKELAIEALDLDAPAFDDDGEKSLQTILGDDETESPVERIEARAMRAEVRRALGSLTPREARILRLYYGLDGQQPLTLSEIASICHLSRERIRQIKDRALDRLRRGRRGRRLASFA